MLMAKVNHESITTQHVKAARALLEWTAADLARESSVGVTTIRKWESGTHVRADSVQAIYDALVDAGIAFQNGGKPGVRLVKE